MPDAVVVEFESGDRIVDAAVHLRQMGYSSIEAYTPFSMPELAAAIGTKRTRLPWLVFLAGAMGVSLAYLVLWWTSAVDYRLDVGGRPLNSILTDIPIMFEATVLFASGTAFLAALVRSGLPRLHHPVFELRGFERTTVDRFWLTIGAIDEAGDAFEGELEMLRAALLPFGPVAVRDAHHPVEER